MSKSIAGAQYSLFRFEGLQDYSAEDGQKAVDDFIKTGSFGDMSWKNAWWNKMKERNKKGIKTARVRLVTKSLTDYTKMEVAFLAKAAEFSGDDIRIIEDEDFKKLNLGTIRDFWMIDEKQVFLMEYGPKGKLLNTELVEGPKIEPYIRAKSELLNRTVSILHFKG